MIPATRSHLSFFGSFFFPTGEKDTYQQVTRGEGKEARGFGGEEIGLLLRHMYEKRGTATNYVRKTSRGNAYSIRFSTTENPKREQQDRTEQGKGTLHGMASWHRKGKQGVRFP